MKFKVHPAISKANDILEAIPETTGKSVEEWTQILADAGMTTSKAMATYLRDQYSIGRPTALVLFAKIKNIRADFEDKAYLEAAPAKIDRQYTGGKRRLRPIADVLFSELDKLGADVGASPSKANVVFYRQHLFAQVEAAAQNGLDVGLALAGYKGKIPDHFENVDGNGKGHSITHKVSIASLEGVDAELIHWMKTAYELDK